MRFFWAMVSAFPLAAVALVKPALGQVPSQTSSSPSTGQVSLQAEFNQASDAELASNCAVALPIFARLALDPRVKPGSLPAGAIAVRRGICLVATGLFEDGVASIQAGLPILERVGPDFVGDMVQGEDSLGVAAVARWQHDTAIAHFKSALAKLIGTSRISVLTQLANVSAFDGGPEPLAFADEALRLTDALDKTDKTAKMVKAAVHTIRGRILMNQGRNKEALGDLREALDLSGGLTSRITLEEGAMRGDLAQAALLTGDKDKARLYLAYTGAGRIQESPFAVAANMEPPLCGPDTGLRPEDSAIVEFSIGDNGDVIAAQTVYSRGSYAVAAAFAKAVSQWYWHPADLARLPQFYRTVSRIELRCSNRGGNVPDSTSPLKQRFIAWAAAHLPSGETVSGGLGAEMERFGRIAGDREKAGDIPGAVAAFGVQAYLDPKPTAVTLQRYDQALKLAASASLPSEVFNELRAFRAQSAAYVRFQASSSPTNDGRAFAAELAQLAHDPEISKDALAQDTLLLGASPSRPSAEQLQTTRNVLLGVAEDSRLAEHHPLRQLALLQLANLAVSASDFASAQAYFQRTGLSEEQCALIGAKPAMRSTGASGNDYPMEALMMGFEGWVNLEFDISADGRTANARPIIAYPPFVFVDAAQGMAKDIRYTASYRPSGGAACAANREVIRFAIPDNH